MHRVRAARAASKAAWLCHDVTCAGGTHVFAVSRVLVGMPCADLLPSFVGIPHLGDEPRQRVAHAVLVHQRQALLIVPGVPRVAARLAQRPAEGAAVEGHWLIAAAGWLGGPLQELAGCLCAGDCREAHRTIGSFTADGGQRDRAEPDPAAGADPPGSPGKGGGAREARMRGCYK